MGRWTERDATLSRGFRRLLNSRFYSLHLRSLEDTGNVLEVQQEHGIYIDCKTRSCQKTDGDASDNYAAAPKVREKALQGGQWS